MADLKKGLKKTLSILAMIIFFIGLAIIVLITFIDLSSDQDVTNDDFTNTELVDTLPDSSVIKAATSEHDTNIHIIRVSDVDDLNIPHGVDEEAGKVKRVFSGRRINIAIIGVDSRLGSSFKHADANHVVSILVDEGVIEITSIPRDTPCDAMQEDSMQNKLTVLYPARGQQAYFKEVAQIAELDKIHYYIEVGFSQARGILQLLGYKDSGSALQILRSRTALGGNDYQRVYNQAQFIRQMFLKHFDKLTGFFSDVLIRGGLAIVESNLTSSKAEEIFSNLKSKGFPKSPDDISIRIRPPIGIQYKIYDFSDSKTMSALRNRIEGINESSTFSQSSSSYTVAGRLNYKINRAIQDSASNPQKVINDLKTLFNQRAWLQVDNQVQRDRIRDEFGILLYEAYKKKKQMDKAEEIRRAIEAEKKLFSVPVF
jgi:anionic cell wall polymer biosynthesis LytR-Cps2A-Psr (LCP) family protein